MNDAQAIQIILDELEPWQRDLVVSFMRPLRDANIDWALHDEYGSASD